jgi:hypothetical protein
MAPQPMSPQTAGGQAMHYAQPPTFGMPASTGATPHGGMAQVRIAHGGGGACPHCFGYVYANRYTWAHLFIGICFFPIGFLVYVFPIRCCQCGNEYGFGRWVVSICTWVAVLVVALLILVFAIGLRESAERTSGFRRVPNSLAAVSRIISTPHHASSVAS